MSSSSDKKSKAKSSKLPASKKSKLRILFNLDNPEHNALVSASISDDETSGKNSTLIIPETVDRVVGNNRPVKNGRKRKSNAARSTNKKTKNLKSELSRFQGSNILFGNDDINPDELDEHGNLKDLIDYDDPQDYSVYETEMKRRERKEQMMTKRAHIIFSDHGDGADEKSVKIRKESDDEYNYESEDDSESDDKLSEEIEELSEDDNELANMQQPVGILIPYLLGGQLGAQPHPENDSLAQFRARVTASNMPEQCKQLALKRLANADPDKPKIIEWIETLLSVPFGKLAISPVTINDPLPKIRGFFDQTIKQFDRNIYGLTNVKQQIVDYLGQFISAGSGACPRTLALCGGPGIGKTYLVRHGIADALGRPLRAINMGGIKDSAHMCGFEYSYANARYGVMVQVLIEKQIMNPVILFEEVDKISETRDGQDIQNVLMHLTDPEQNKAFQDKYFSGVDFDLSKAILVFTLNNPSALSPILLNRLHLVNVPDPSREDKIQIAKRHMLPEIFKNVNMSPDSIIVPDKIYEYILDRYSQNDKGLRTLKGCLETIILRLNMIRFIGRDLSGKLRLTFPIALNSEIVDQILQAPSQPLSMYL